MMVLIAPGVARGLMVKATLVAAAKSYSSTMLKE
jgi:hypothetical protein